MRSSVRGQRARQRVHQLFKLDELDGELILLIGGGFAATGLFSGGLAAAGADDSIAASLGSLLPPAGPSSCWAPTAASGPGGSTTPPSRAWSPPATAPAGEELETDSIGEQMDRMHEVDVEIEVENLNVLDQRDAGRGSMLRFVLAAAE